MPKQMHLSKDFFVNASEEEARNHILHLPQWVSNIKFVEENPVRRSFRFVYERHYDNPENFSYVDVSLLPLNVHQTRVTLHGSYVSGAVFQRDFKVSNALSNFESAIHAMLKGSINEYQPEQMKMNTLRGITIILALVGVAAAIVFIKNFFA